MKIHRFPWKSMEIHGNPWKYMENHENPSQSMEHHENPSKSMKTNENRSSSLPCFFVAGVHSPLRCSTMAGAHCCAAPSSRSSTRRRTTSTTRTSAGVPHCASPRVRIRDCCCCKDGPSGAAQRTGTRCAARGVQARGHTRRATSRTSTPDPQVRPRRSTWRMSPCTFGTVRMAVLSRSQRRSASPECGRPTS